MSRPPLKSEGQRLLAERAEGVVALARIVGVPKQRIEDWRGGTRPGAANAARLRDKLGIPLDAWSRRPVAGAGGYDVDADGSVVAGSTATAARTSLAEIDEMLEELRRGAGALVERDRQKRAAERISLLRLKSQIEHRQALVEDAIVRTHPHWKRIREALRTALAKHPEALADVRAELAALGEWEAATSALVADEDE